MASGFLPHHALVTHEQAAPRSWMLVLHGIFGSGRNWRTFARKLTARRPDWGLVLVDLRMHGNSQGAPGAHRVASAAADVARLGAELERQGHPVRAVFGHSFGGKVALGYRQRASGDLWQTWLIDSSPSARPGAMDEPDNTVVEVLRTLAALPPSFASRQEFVDAVSARGHRSAIGHWLAMNLERASGRFTSRLDPSAMEQLLSDYYQQDAWSAVSAGPGQLHVVVAGRSSSIREAERERLAQLSASGAPVTMTIFPDSGHWVHIEALEPLLAAVAGKLPRDR